MLDWTDEELEEAGMDPAKVASIVRRLRRLSRDMREQGVHVYGASGNGHLVHPSRPTHSDHGRNAPNTDAPIADLGPGFDGGDW